MILVMAGEGTERRPPTVAEAVGGPLGMVETSLPAVAFVIAYMVSGSDTNASAIVAVVLALAISVVRLVRRESPRHALSGLVGVIVGQLDGEGNGWRADPARVRAFARATWMWAGLFVVRLAVQLPLYLASAVVALGIARTAMGLPLFAVGLWLTWRLVRRQTPAGPATV